MHNSAAASVSGGTYTMVPNEYLDDLMPLVTSAEWKVVSYVMRRTAGFHRTADAISIAQMVSGITRADGVQLDRGTGESESTVKRAVRNLIERKVLVVQRRREGKRDLASTYALRVPGEGGQIDPPPELDRGVILTPGGGSIWPPQKKGRKKEETKENAGGVGPAAQLGLGGQPPVIQPAVPTKTRAPPEPSPAWLLTLAAALVESLDDVGHPGKLRELLREQWFRRPPAVTPERFRAIVAQAEAESKAKADVPAAWFSRRLRVLMLEEAKWPGGRPPASPHRDDRSPTEKAANPRRGWVQTFGTDRDPFTPSDSAEGGTAP